LVLLDPVCVEVNHMHIRVRWTAAAMKPMALEDNKAGTPFGMPAFL
jgi:hypothetical protein